MGGDPTWSRSCVGHQALVIRPQKVSQGSCQASDSYRVLENQWGTVSLQCWDLHKRDTFILKHKAGLLVFLTTHSTLQGKRWPGDWPITVLSHIKSKYNHTIPILNESALNIGTIITMKHELVLQTVPNTFQKVG